MREFDVILTKQGLLNRFQEFQNLIRYRVREILLVSSLYDSFILEQDGQLSEMLLHQYLDLNLINVPIITRVSSGLEAINLVHEDPNRFQVIITTMHVGDMSAVALSRRVLEANLPVPVVMLVYDARELTELTAYHDVKVFEKVFIWQGDFRTLIAIVKYLEDRQNVAHDTEAVGVQSIIVIEDNVAYYSALLPMIYIEVFKHTRSLMAEGINSSHRMLRMRARPKILLCATYEEAAAYYRKYEHCILGVISDVEFPREGKLDAEAGIRFARDVKASHFDIPILLESDDPQFESVAHQLGAGFLLKRSPTVLQQLRQFMIDNFSFGDFIFRMPDGRIVGQADDLRSLEEQLRTVPIESIRYHAERNHFSRWLKARTEFWLAHQLRPRQVSDYNNADEFRAYLVGSLHDFRMARQTGAVADFEHHIFDPQASFARIGIGSLGGKARGLGFVNALLKNLALKDSIDGVEIAVPPAVVLATDVFDQFMDANNLRDFSMHCQNDEELRRRFFDSLLPELVTRDLAALMELMRYPLAVRSSSLLEDSRYQPFAGIYQTYMLPNNHPDSGVRLKELVSAIKQVYASTYSQGAKNYIVATPYRLEEEKMAVIIQRLVGSQHENRFYPNIAGVARSYNFYPHPPLSPTDGIASVALGLGTIVVDGGKVVRFSPRFPHHMVQLSEIEDTLRNTQTEFYAVELQETAETDNIEMHLKSFGLEVAEADGTLWPVASSYSRENDTITDGLSRSGVRLVTLAPILKHGVFPLANVLRMLLEVGQWGLSMPVEIEFAANFAGPSTDSPKQFAILQLRPLVVNQESEELAVDHFIAEDLICRSSQVLGHGVIDNIFDVIVVDPENFERERSRDVALEISRFNAELVAQRRPYLIIGCGRWGSSDPWLGIPVSWDQMSGVRVIIESGLRDVDVTPSQGSHFFQNITSLRVGYYTISDTADGDFVSWHWLRDQRALAERRNIRHLRFATPVTVRMNGRTNTGVVLKPRV